MVTDAEVVPFASAGQVLAHIIREFFDNTAMSEIKETVPATADEPAREERFLFPENGGVSILLETAWSDDRLAIEEVVRRRFEAKGLNGFILMPVREIAYTWCDSHYRLTVIFDRSRIAETRPRLPDCVN